MTDAAIEIVRTFAHPAPVVFQAWTVPDLLEVWLAERAEVDLRIGGQYRLESEGDDDLPGLHICSGTYREIEPNRRIVKSWTYDGPMAAEPLETLVTVEINPLGPEEAELVFREEGSMLTDLEENKLAIEAWTAAFDELEEVLDELDQQA